MVNGYSILFDLALPVRQFSEHLEICFWGPTLTHQKTALYACSYTYLLSYRHIIFLETSFGTWLWQSSTRIVCCLPSMLELASKSLPVINRVSAIKFQWQVGLVGLQYVFGRNVPLVGIADEVFIRILTWMMVSHMWVLSVFCWLDQFCSILW